MFFSYFDTNSYNEEINDLPMMEDKQSIELAMVLYGVDYNMMEEYNEEKPTYEEISDICKNSVKSDNEISSFVSSEIFNKETYPFRERKVKDESCSSGDHEKSNEEGRSCEGQKHIKEEEFPDEDLKNFDIETRGFVDQEKLSEEKDSTEDYGNYGDETHSFQDEKKFVERKCSVGDSGMFDEINRSFVSQKFEENNKLTTDMKPSDLGTHSYNDTGEIYSSFYERLKKSVEETLLSIRKDTEHKSIQASCNDIKKGQSKRQCSKSTRNCSIFPACRFNRLLRKRTHLRVAPAAGVYVAATIEYLINEVFFSQLSVREGRRRKRIDPRLIFMGIQENEDLTKLCQSVWFPSVGGVGKPYFRMRKFRSYKHFTDFCLKYIGRGHSDTQK
ncbi:hypothetical protein DICVIV_00932 [Dictyocaulus viviparus]|uniref:Core histone H2A/H2B/H3/H4 n=1 Tax=Dictyocaulus viviparus TaxID=29172 RepID=A0A0D8YE43_DICVI|nr:hypothetical protein DICVIV_00932 [Dictyocaulus viviparus]